MTTGRLRSRLRRGTAEAFALQAAGAVLLFSMHVVLARAVGVDGYGVFAYALALAGVLAVVAPLGWPTALIRLISQYAEQRRWSLLRGALQRAYQTTALGAILGAVLLLVVSYLVSVELASSLRFAALLLPLLAFVGLRRKALQALKRVKASIAGEEVLLPLLVICGALLLNVVTASGVLLVYAGAAFVVFLLSNAWLWRSLPAEARAAKPEFRTRAWMAIALPMVFGGASQILMNRTDVLLLGALVGTEAVGLYNVAARIALLNVFVLNAVNTVAAPMMASSFHDGRLQETKRILRGAMLLSSLGALPLLVLMLLWPGLLLGFFGADFVVGGEPLLRILALGQFVNAATGPVGFALLMTGRERAFALTLGVVAVANLAGNLLAIPLYGAVGAAVVTAASVVVLNCWQYALSMRTRL